MTVLLASTADSQESWKLGLQGADLPLPLRVWPEVGDVSEIEYAIVAKPPAGLLASLPNLKAVFSIWAGIDHITCDPDWPRHVPVYRMIEPGLTTGMVEFVLSQVLNLHLGNYDVVAAQADKQWLREPRGAYGMEPLVHERGVTVLGLGEMGRNTAVALRNTGFQVSGWSRNKKTIEGVTCFDGQAGFKEALARGEILVNLLPLTVETEDILNKGSFGLLPKGAGFINTGRGQHVVDGDLIEALDSGHLSRAVLDVFRTEPLPADDPFWTHPKVTIYPHIASVTRVRTGVEALVRSLETVLNGAEPEGRYDPDRGY